MQFSCRKDALIGSFCQVNYLDQRAVENGKVRLGRAAVARAFDLAGIGTPLWKWCKANITSEVGHPPVQEVCSFPSKVCTIDQFLGPAAGKLFLRFDERNTVMGSRLYVIRPSRPIQTPAGLNL
jgi:hypothetical protein